MSATVNSRAFSTHNVIVTVIRGYFSATGTIASNDETIMLIIPGYTSATGPLPFTTKEGTEGKGGGLNLHKDD